MFIPVIHFSYETEESIRRGCTVLTHPIAHNEAAAKEMVEELSQKKWIVWYDPDHPERATLQNSFPLKESLSALTLLGVFLYLAWLGYSMRRYQ